MKTIIASATLLVLSAPVLAGTAPTQIPIVSEFGLVGMSLILGGFAARLIAKKLNKS